VLESFFSIFNSFQPFLQKDPKITQTQIGVFLGCKDAVHEPVLINPRKNAIFPDTLEQPDLVSTLKILAMDSFAW
jgi:hypothetical protein